MACTMGQNKGKRTERAVVQLLQPVVNRVYEERGLEPPQLLRNTMQSRAGGYDIVGLEWLALEVKHQETLNLSAWWEQAERQARPTQTPVLLYKQNNHKFRARMIGFLAHQGSSYDRVIHTLVDISADAFLLYLAERITHELENANAN